MTTKKSDSPVIESLSFTALALTYFSSYVRATDTSLLLRHKQLTGTFHLYLGQEVRKEASSSGNAGSSLDPAVFAVVSGIGASVETAETEVIEVSVLVNAVTTTPFGNKDYGNPTQEQKRLMQIVLDANTGYRAWLAAELSK